MTAARDDGRHAASGSLFALAAFLTWGAAPLYFHAVAHVPPLEILCHRIAWSALLLVAVAAGMSRMGPVLQALRNPLVRRALVGTAVLIALNWLTFLWAVERKQVLQVSLGYFTNPLVNVALGAAFLGERLHGLQKVAVAIAGASVLYLAISAREIPGIALVLAVSFGLYGLFRKMLPVDPLTGLLIETVALWPAAVAYLVVLQARGTASLGATGRATDALLVLSGAWTAVPLLCFVAATKRLTLTAVGFFQYLAPTIQFGLAVFLWHEPFGGQRLVAFCGIWVALALVSFDAIARNRQAARARLTRGT